jgi:hypothetical protein
MGGAMAIVLGAILLGVASSQGATSVSSHPLAGISAALGAALLWGTMYIPYRKAYLSGMNPLSFVTIFTVGEIVTVSILALVFEGGLHPLAAGIAEARPSLFWLFLGGFCWVIGDLFQQYAAKYIGIGRGIPLSNTNQLWGLAWGALVFGELSGADTATRTLVLAGSVVMIAGAAAIASAAATEGEQTARSQAVARECVRYGLDSSQVEAALAGEESGIGFAAGEPRRRTWDLLIAAAAISTFVWLGLSARRPSLEMNLAAVTVLSAASLAMLGFAGYRLWKRTRFL